MKRVCVFTGSAVGARDAYALAAQSFGRELVRRGGELVYGGGGLGLMGVVADAVLDSGGLAIGVIPESLEEKELAHSGLTELHVVGSMHERKSLMAKLSHAFVALPGGLGTFEELFEMLTWLQLGIHEKPCGVLNVEGYFDPLLRLVDNAVAEKFARAEHAEMICIESSPARLLDRLAQQSPPIALDKWLSS